MDSSSSERENTLLALPIFGMEMISKENFDIQPNHSSLEALRKWRSAVSVVTICRRRFRRTANLEKRDKVEKKKLSIQEGVTATPALQQPEQQRSQRHSSSSQSIPVNGGEGMENWVISIRDRLERARHDNCASSWTKPCIYRVPECLRENDDNAFVPQVVSLGPYHHNRDERLSNMDFQKWRSLDRILARTHQDVTLYLDSIREVEVKARSCYEGPIYLTSHQFVEMMVLDGCFMLELFRGASQGFTQLGYPPDDPIYALSGIMQSIRQDMVMLENQIPLFILDRLLAFQFGIDGPDQRFLAAKLALRFLDPLVPTDEPLWNTNQKKWIRNATTAFDPLTDLGGLHCLDIFRRDLLRRKPLDLPRNRMRWKPQPLGATDNRRQQLIRCATELTAAGVKFKKRTTDRFWDVKFENGTLWIPRLLVNEGTKSLLLNLKAYEQCHLDCGNEITSYLILMDNLINSAADVRYLIRCKILEHWLGSDAEVAKFFNCLCRQVEFGFEDSNISQLSVEVNCFCDKRCNEWLASLRKKHCRNPWTICSIVAGVVLLLLTLVQTFYTVYSYYRPSSHVNSK